MSKNQTIWWTAERHVALDAAAASGHPGLAGVLAAWRHAQANGGRIDPLRLPRSLLPEVMLLDPAPGGGLAVRLAGTEHCRRFGRELRGLGLDQFLDPYDARRIGRLAALAARRGEPTMSNARWRSQRGEAWRFVGLLAPLVRGGDDIDGFLIVTVPARPEPVD